MTNSAWSLRPTRAVVAIAFALAVLSLPAQAAPADTAWTVVGTGVPAVSGDGGQAREAAIQQPRTVSALPGGGFSWAEPYTNRVRLVDRHGVVRPLAGTGEPGFSGDGGPAVAARLNFVHTAAPTMDGGFLLADTRNSRIRKIAANGIISTVAGNGFWGYGGDGGPATRAHINNPRSVLPLPDGGFLIADTDNHRVRRVSRSGVITTVAGTGVEGYGGDGGPATAARLALPFALSSTADGGLLIADIGNQRIRKISAEGTMTTVAGTGLAGFSGDGGPATAARLHDPHDVLALADGAFLIADTSNERVRRVSADGTITTLIGDGVRGASGDGGPADRARVASPKSLALTAAGDLVIADEQSNKIRFVGAVVAPANTEAPSVSGTPAVGKTLLAGAGGWSGTGPLISYRWQRCAPGCSDLADANGRTYVVRAGDAGAKLRVVVTATNPAGTTSAGSAPVTVTKGASAGTAGGSGGGSRPAPGGSSGSGTGATPGPAGPTGPSGAPARWLVRTKTATVVVGEYVIGRGRTRLADAIGAYGPAACKRVAPKRVIATWAERGLALEAKASRPVGTGVRACSDAGRLEVVAIRLTDRRWVTSLGLRVGDSTTRLGKLYPAARRAGTLARNGQHHLASARIACTNSCPSRARFVRVRVAAHVTRGRVTALWIKLAAVRR